MNKIGILFLMASVFCLPVIGQERELADSLHTLTLVRIDTLEHDEFFTEKYAVILEQPIDYTSLESPAFTQRFIIAHKGFDKPVVFITEGYSAFYGLMPRLIPELCAMLDANMVLVEHRYFAESVPKPLDWQYLTVENAANDHHRIVEMIKPFYTGRWISSGISKGGQTALYHRYFFPEDVDATVGYVCPLNFSTEDRRVYDFLENVGDSVCRQRVFDFQKMMLERETELLGTFQKLAEEKGQHYSGGIRWGYELTVMEYSFAFWQWGNYSCDQIPDASASPELLIRHLNAVAGLDWISEEGIAGMQPFFYQAMTEIGMYGYDLKAFGNLIRALDSGTFEFTCPDSVDCIYDPVPMRKVDDFVRHEADKMMFLYGEYDPWSATAVQWSGNPGVRVIYKPKGHHTTRIGNMPPSVQEKVCDQLRDWLEIPVKCPYLWEDK